MVWQGWPLASRISHRGDPDAHAQLMDGRCKEVTAMARVSAPSIIGAALEQARGFSIDFFFEGVDLEEANFPA
eukprot:11207543-Lingulodinium_polyedra.AAC.1